MVIRVLFFGQLKEIVGKAEEACLAPDSWRLEDLFASYAEKFPRLGEFRASVAAAINQDYAAWDACLRAGDEVAFLPPVSGGQQRKAAANIYRIVREKIAAEEIVAGLKAGEDGAVAVFEGIVRNHSKGKPTLYLEYEAYEAMALGKMREIGATMREKFAIDRLAMVHRLGRLEIGETSVLVAVSAAHRGAAFDACRYGIDTLKRAVPIWKKEYFADGAVWADGEIPSTEAFSVPKPSTS
ncbi:MAG TPA: molybdenum cofactor biosynthesis protein MoaE [Candidatus Acidoferrales bacterium]|nr:molybdenum cofactor biosynthesis protein MoaE [Candidatus Acidoferrales bacterium]